MNTLSSKLNEITVETFESLCRLFPLAEHDYVEEPAPTGTVFVRFTGSVDGTFCIQFLGQLPKTAATAMLGGVPSPHQEEDAMKEIANVICGNILPYVAGSETVLQLSAPQLVPSAIFPGTAAAHAFVSFPTGRIHLTIFLNTPQPIS